MTNHILSIGTNRALHLVDAENITGCSLVTEEAMQKAFAAYVAAVPIGPNDQIIVASAHASIFAVGMGWPGGRRLLMRSGKDGADICLAQVVAEENVEMMFDRVYLASGDGGLAPFAAHLAGRGVQVTAVSLRHSLSRRMRMAASAVIFLDAPGIAVRSVA